jgi:hypothetical protein
VLEERDEERLDDEMSDWHVGEVRRFRILLARI